MKIKRKIAITINAELEIDTDKVEYGIHGGEDEPEEIADKAVAYYVQETDYGIDSPDSSITVLKTEMVNYEKV